MALVARTLDRERHVARRAGRLAEQHLPLVRTLARRVGREVGWCVALDDLVGPGHEGLFAAARRFDRTRGASFATFAGYRVRGAMLDAVRALPPRMLGDELLAALPAREGTAEDAALAGEARARVQRAVATLPAPERHVVTRVYFEGAALAEAGSEVGVSKSWASRLHARALRRLRRTLQQGSEVR